jgi:hypothetical protein
MTFETGLFLYVDTVGACPIFYLKIKLLCGTLRGIILFHISMPVADVEDWEEGQKIVRLNQQLN